VALDLSKLNPPQREAVTHPAGPLLVLAGAGSGKTRVIIHRIASLLERGIPADAIAALTFTNKAAEEMRGRIAALLGSRKAASKLTMGTFHSLGLQILRAERASLGFPRGFAIYDASDQLGLIKELLRRVHADGRRYDAKAILSRISLAKNAFVPPESFEPAEGDEYDEIAAELYPRYQESLRAFAAVDFDDLITETVALLEREPEVRDRWQARFHHVLVDEYQDTNRAQLLFVKQLVAQHHNLCVVGDDDQSIYSWRGADPTNMRDFEQFFPGARVVVLDQNYRSTPTILEAANAVIANNTSRREKNLWSDKERGEKLQVVVAPDGAMEVAFVAREVQALVREHGRRHKDIAVLYRSNTQTRALEEELRTADVPYAMFGGQQFFERKEVKDVIAYLRAALNPRDEISLRRVLNYPSRGIGARALSKLAAGSEARGTSLWRALTGEGGVLDELSPQARDGVASFTAIMSKLRAALDGDSGSGSAAAATRELLEDIDLYEDIRAAAPSLTAAQRKIDNVESLIRSLERREQRGKDRSTLAEYLRQLALDTGGDEPSEPGDKVVLTTLHGAKGLEFPVVFLIGAEEELLPHARTLMPQAHDVSDPDHASDVSEERRLAYVGITRAMERLYLTRAAARRLRGRAVERTPSRFLLEIPEELVELRDAEAEARAPAATEELRAFFQTLAQD
jgi:superfamily I DNA/RNA helicase